MEVYRSPNYFFQQLQQLLAVHRHHKQVPHLRSHPARRVPQPLAPVCVFFNLEEGRVYAAHYPFDCVNPVWAGGEQSQGSVLGFYLEELDGLSERCEPWEEKVELLRGAGVGYYVAVMIEVPGAVGDGEEFGGREVRCYCGEGWL